MTNETIETIFWQFWQLKRQFWRLVIFETLITILTIDDNFHNSDNCFCHFDNWKDNPGDLWHLRHWLQFWQLRTWIHDNLCYLTINCDTGQHSQFLRCLALTWQLNKQPYHHSLTKWLLSHFCFFWHFTLRPISRDNLTITPKFAKVKIHNNFWKQLLTTMKNV